MEKKNKTILLYIVLGWVLAAYPIYLLLSFTRIFLNQASVIVLGIFIFVVGTGIFIGAAKKKMRENKIDALLDDKLHK